jgi:integrase
MGTICSRRRRDGTIGYTAQIRIKRAGKLVHTEAETFEKKAVASEWLRRREAALDVQRARGEPLGRVDSVASLIDWYICAQKELTPWGRSKESDLKRLRGYPISAKAATRLTVSDYVHHAEDRKRSGTGPATIGNDFVWLRQVFRSARASLDIPIQLSCLDDAVHELRTRRLIAKSSQRDRRLTREEEEKLMQHFASRDARSSIPMTDIMAFALLTARRQEEITRLLWKDLDREKRIGWLDDVKHPRKKIGNRKSFRLLEDAWAIIERQPQTAPEVFPYDPKSIGAAFTRACKILGISDLHFHDLRHEATSRLFERGYDIPQVAQFTLHESWATLRRYTHLRPEDVPEMKQKPTRME